MTGSDQKAHFHPASNQLRSKLKEPLGQLIPDAEISRPLLAKLVFLRGASLISSVGDTTSARLRELGLEPNLEVFDNYEQRVSRTTPLKWNGAAERFLRTVNPPGGIDDRALATIKTSLDLFEADHRKKVGIFVEGEEDLLVLPLGVLPTGRSFTLYGQPNEGLVIVDSLKSKDLCSNYLKELGITLG